MSAVTPNMSLTKWDINTDNFSYSVLAANLDKIDVHDHASGKGKQVAVGGIAPNAVTTTTIADLNVTSGKIANGAVGSTQLADSGVTTVKLNTGAVTPAKFAQVPGVRLAGDPVAVAGAGTTATLAFNAETYDYDSMHFSADAFITVNTAGIYLIDFETTWASIPSSPGERQMNLTGARTDIYRVTNTGSSINHVVIARLQVADTIGLEAKINSPAGGQANINVTPALRVVWVAPY